MGRPGAVRTFKDLACGFCGLGCDDLEAVVEGRAVRPRGRCAEAVALLRRSAGPPPPPRVGGREVTLAEAVAAARRHLAASRAAVFSGLGADVAGLRGLADLAVRFGASLDHMASTGLFRALDTLQRRGWVAATLAELRNRCDVLMVIGDDPARTFPRFFERAFPPAGTDVGAPLFVTGPRRLVFLGAAPDQASLDLAAGHEVFTLPVPKSLLADALAAIRGFLKGRSSAEFAGAFAGETGARLSELAGLLREAHYSVLTFEAGQLPAGAAERVVEEAAGIVARLNQTTRAAVFPISGRDNLIGANHVMLWRFGYPLRTLVGAGGARHAPDLYATGTALKDADLLLHASAFRPAPPPAFAAGPVIALAHPETEFADEPDVFIPIGTPGVDHPGDVFRMDSVVCLPLEGLREAGLPALAAVCAAIAGERP